MSEFRKLSDSFYASPQVTPQEISEAAAMGITLVVNNRPDGEALEHWQHHAEVRAPPAQRT